MIKMLLLFFITCNLFALENNASKIASLEDDPLFHANRENGLTLYEAINEALINSRKIDAEKQYVIQQHEKLNEAIGAHLPVVNLSGDGGYEDRTFKGDPKFNNKPPITSVYKYKKTDLYLTITENIWAGGSLQNSVNEKEAMVAMANYDYRNKVEKLVLDVARAYYGVVYAEIALKISEKNMKNYEKILKIVTIKERNGAATKGDVNFIKANVENAKNSLALRKKTLQDAISNYTYLLNSHDSQSLPYETSSVLYLKDLNTTLDDAQNNNAKLLKQKTYTKAMKYKFLATKGKFAPKLDLSINGESRNEFDIGIGQREKVNALLTFNYNLYNGGRDEALAARYLAKLREQRYLSEEIKRKLIYDIKVLHQSITTLSQSLQFTQNEVISSRKVVKSYWISFQHGTQDLQALQLAQLNLNRAEQDYAKYKKDLVLNNLELMQKAGVLLQYINVQHTLNPKELEHDFNLFWSYEDLK